jgi:hypothetical protein
MQQRGLSLIWCLIIIAVTVNICVFLHIYYSRSGCHLSKLSRTRPLMKTIEIACEAYRIDFGAYPPDKVIVDGKPLKSSAALAWFLMTPFRAHPNTGERQATEDYGAYLDPQVRFSQDVDGDGFPEIVDPWGRPIEYDNLRDDPGGFDFYGPDDPRTDHLARNVKSFDLFTHPIPETGQPIANWEADR